MIRINLLEETRVEGKAKGRGFALPELQLAENVPLFICGGIVIAAVTVMAFWYFSYRIKIDSLDDQITDTKAKVAKLEHVRKAADDLRRSQDELTRKIEVITQLKANQTVPVQMLDRISRNLADHVWLEDMSFTTGNKLTLQGMAQTPLAVSNFLRNLEQSEYFADVEMGTVRNNRGLTEFSVNMRFRIPGQPEPEPTDRASRRGGGKRRGR